MIKQITSSQSHGYFIHDFEVSNSQSGEVSFKFFNPELLKEIRDLRIECGSNSSDEIKAALNTIQDINKNIKIQILN